MINSEEISNVCVLITSSFLIIFKFSIESIIGNSLLGVNFKAFTSNSISKCPSSRGEDITIVLKSIVPILEKIFAVKIQPTSKYSIYLIKYAGNSTISLSSKTSFIIPMISTRV